MITKKQEVDELTLIECFDALAPQNIASCLYLQPRELIFLGDQTQIDPYLPRYRALLSQRNMNTKITCRYVAMDNIESIVRQLQQILRQEDDFVIDIPVATNGSWWPPERRWQVWIRKNGAESPCSNSTPWRALVSLWANRHI